MYGYAAGDYDPDPEFFPFWTGYPGGDPPIGHPFGEQMPPAVSPEPDHQGNIWATAEPTSAPPRPTAESERALHQLGLITGRYALPLMLQDLREQLNKLQPGGSWMEREIAAANKAKLLVVNAIDLLSNLS